MLNECAKPLSGLAAAAEYMRWWAARCGDEAAAAATAAANWDVGAAAVVLDVLFGLVDWFGFADDDEDVDEADDDEDEDETEDVDGVEAEIRSLLDDEADDWPTPFNRLNESQN